MRLTDLVRQVVGHPIDLHQVAELLARADAVLPGGRDYVGELTGEQVSRLLDGHERLPDGCCDGAKREF